MKVDPAIEQLPSLQVRARIRDLIKEHSKFDTWSWPLPDRTLADHLADKIVQMLQVKEEVKTWR